MKTCPKCGSSENGFFKNRANKDGLSTWCKKCHSENTIQRAKENRNVINARRREWYANNPGKGAEIARNWRSTHPPTEEQKQRAIERVKNWVHENPEQRNKIANSWVKNNRGKASAAWMRRHAIKLKATPPWVDHEAIKQFYIRAAALTKYTGIRYEVDHIIPLRCKDKNGLHVHWNLQILTFEEHRRKCGIESREFQT
jgi:hypothetical protein